MIRFSSAMLFMVSMLHAASLCGEPGAVPGRAHPASVSPAAFQPASAVPDSLNFLRAAPALKDTAAARNVITLDEIQIQGEVEKPSVIILPKRIEPEMQADSLDRSFSQEIRRSTDEVPTPDQAINRVEPVKSIKKEIEKKRK
jgi:hypothetical protein